MWHLAGQEILRRSVWVGLPSSDRSIYWEGQKEGSWRKERRKSWTETGQKKGGFQIGTLLILPVVHHANKAACDTDCPSRTSPFYQLKPRQEMPMGIDLLTTLVRVVYSTYLGFFAGATVSFTFFFVCKQCSHVNKAVFGRETLFIFHLKIKEFPNNLTLSEVLEVWKHARTSLIWPNLSFQAILWVSCWDRSSLEFLETTPEFLLLLLFFLILLY